MTPENASSLPDRSQTPSTDEEIIFPAPPAETDDGLCDVGILFVHGIGEQARGETLLQFGAPIHKWLQCWFDGITLKWVEAGINWNDIQSWIDETNFSLKADDPRLYPLLLSWCRETKDQNPSRQPGDAGKFQRLQEDVGYRTVVSRVEFAETALGKAAGDAPSSAHLDMLWVGADASVRESRWLLAESWWAETFSQPSFLNVAKWSGVVLPWTIGSHIATVNRRFKERWMRSELRQRLYKLMRRQPTPAKPVEWKPDWLERKAGWIRNAPWALPALLFLPLGLLLSLVLVVLMFLLALVSLIPLTFVSKFTSGVQQKLASYFGDSYILVSNPMQAAAIVSQVRRDLEWLSQRCRRVVLVAHSQGGAVAHLLAREGYPKRLEMVLAFGSGLRKLDELSILERPRSWQSFFNKMIIVSPLVTIFGVYDYLADGRIGAYAWIIYLSVLLMFILSCLIWGSSDPDQWELNYWRRTLKDKGLAWLEYYASADPVPNGPTFEEPRPQTPAQDGRIAGDPYEVHNRLSLLTDHTSYMENTDGFVSEIVRSIAQLEGDKFSDVFPSDAEYMEQIRARRRWRVRWLARARKLAWLCVLLVVVMHLPEWRKVLLWGYGKVVAGLLAILPFDVPFGPAAQEKPDIQSFYLSLGSVAAIFVCYLIVFQAWRLWDRREVEIFFSRPTGERGWKPRNIFVRFAEKRDMKSKWKVGWQCVCFIATLFSMFWMALMLARPESGAKYLTTWWVPWVFAFFGSFLFTYFAPVLPSFVHKKRDGEAEARADAQSNSNVSP